MLESTGSKLGNLRMFNLIKQKETLGQLENIDSFPGWEKASIFLKSQIQNSSLHAIGDVGGGANPLLDKEFICNHHIDYTLFDISQEELEKAPDYYNKKQIDFMCDPLKFRTVVSSDRYDLIFSHMFLEHIERSDIVHTNIFSALKPGGIAIHFFPSNWNLPLSVNKIFPERITKKMVEIFQPERDLSGMQGKFRAHYSMCGPPSKRLKMALSTIGYEIITYKGYVGHGYYNRVPLIRTFERYLRSFLIRFNIPLTSSILLVLKKPLG